MTDKMIPLSEAQAMVAAALEEAAHEIDCGCAHRAAVLAATGAERWQYCGDPCAALDAREVRALIPDAGAALDRALEKARAEEREACLQAIANTMNRHTIKKHPEAIVVCNEVAAALRARANHGEPK